MSTSSSSSSSAPRVQPSRRRHFWHVLIGKDDKFCALLDAAAEEAKTSVGLLSRQLRTLAESPATAEVADFAESRRRLKNLRIETIAALNKTLVPPFDREDIQALAYALYRIPKVVEKLVERMAIYPGRLPLEPFQRQTEFLITAVDAVSIMVKELLARGPIEKITAANARLQQAEGDADKTMLGIMKDLYQGPYTAKEVVILQSLFEKLERAIDRCRNAGNIVMNITLKNA